MATKMTDPCYCCKKTWPKSEVDKYVIAEGKTVCLEHHGVKAWAKEIAAKAAKASQTEG